MSTQSEASPFAQLGNKLRVARQSSRESLAEVAGAVEIAEDDLRNIERGATRPSEEILMLLIQHFDIQEDEAVSLWELAGYEKDDDEDGSDAQAAKTIIMAIAMDPRVVYSDSVHIQGNQHGLVLNFLQPGGGQLPALPVSRVGMSREQGWQLLRVLHDTLTQLDKLDQSRQLPPETTSK